MQENVFEGCAFYVAEHKYQKKDETKFQKMLKRLDSAGILETLRPWPHKNSVVVFEDIIVFVASGENLEKIRESVKEPAKNPR